MHHGVIMCVCLAPPCINVWYTNSIRGPGRGPQNPTLGPVQSNFNTIRGFICLNLLTKWLPEATTARWITMNLKTGTIQSPKRWRSNLHPARTQQVQASGERGNTAGDGGVMPPLKQIDPHKWYLISPEKPSQITHTHCWILQWKWSTSLCDDTCGSE